MNPYMQISVTQRLFEIRRVIEGLAPEDSVILIKHKDGKIVESRTLTLLHPNHLTAAINTLKDLLHSLESARAREQGELN